MNFRPFRTWLRSTLHKVHGSIVETESESTSELSTRAKWPIDNSLMERIAERAQALKRRGIEPKGRGKPKMILENEDYPPIG
jgi:hypothetical protein